MHVTMINTYIGLHDPANMRLSPNAVSMLAHRLRRWTNIETALVASCLPGCYSLSGIACLIVTHVCRVSNIHRRHARKHTLVNKTEEK